MRNVETEISAVSEEVCASASGKGTEDLEERLRFEIFLADTSARLINLPADWIQEEIRDVQRVVCESLGLDRSTLWLASETEKGSLQLSSSYQRAGCPPVPVSGMDAQEAFPWTSKKVIAGEVVAISKLSDLPPEAAVDRESFLTYGTRSSLVVPLSTGNGASFGALSFAVVRSERQWSDSLMSRIRLVAHIFANALARQRAEKARLESEDRLALATESAGAGLWVIESDTGGLWISPVMRQLLNFTPDEKPAYSSFLDRVHREDREQFSQAIHRALESGGELRIEHRIERPDGSISWLASRGRSRHDASGKPGRLMGASIEITDRKEMEEQLRARLLQIEELKQRFESENLCLKEEVRQLGGIDDIVGQSAGMKKVLLQARQVAETSATILILGETGTGKELLARAIHAMSKRKCRPLVTVNCAALPPTLIESELFGREKGAFTGALTKMIGRFEVADGSTIFLDEIGELPLELQSKLLRVIEEGTFERLGSTKPIHVDVRIIAATNRDLVREVKEGRFRADLFYRLNVFPIVIPPLRQRRGDIPLLAWSFVKELQEKMGKRIESIPGETMEALVAYEWPGNGRELRNVVERAMIVSGGKVLEAVVPEASAAERPGGANLSLQEVERGHILSVLDKTSWRVTGKGGAAEVLGMKGTTLQSKMKKLGIRRTASR